MSNFARHTRSGLAVLTGVVVLALGPGIAQGTETQVKIGSFSVTIPSMSTGELCIDDGGSEECVSQTTPAQTLLIDVSAAADTNATPPQFTVNGNCPVGQSGVVVQVSQVVAGATINAAMADPDGAGPAEGRSVSQPVSQTITSKGVRYCR